MSDAPHASLAAALLAFQSEAPTLPRDGFNPFHRSRFTTLGAAKKVVGPLLAKHGLVWSCWLTTLDGQPALKCELLHPASGESRQETMPLLMGAEDDDETKRRPSAARQIQALGSAITYTRRYALLAVLDLVGEDDDDGNAAMPPRQARTPLPHATRPPEPGPRAASSKQQGLLNARAGARGLSPSQLANILLEASGRPPREFDTEGAAQHWLRAALDRFPAEFVTRALELIDAAGPSRRAP